MYIFSLKRSSCIFIHQVLWCDFGPAKSERNTHIFFKVAKALRLLHFSPKYVLHATVIGMIAVRISDRIRTWMAAGTTDLAAECTYILFSLQKCTLFFKTPPRHQSNEDFDELISILVHTYTKYRRLHHPPAVNVWLTASVLDTDGHHRNPPAADTFNLNATAPICLDRRHERQVWRRRSVPCLL